jgi:hypothetical protein
MINEYFTTINFSIIHQKEYGSGFIEAFKDYLKQKRMFNQIIKESKYGQKLIKELGRKS